MKDVEDKAYKPSMEEISEYINNPLFNELCARLEEAYRPVCKIEYSGDKILLGWNVKFKKAGKTLCTAYPRRGHFPLLLVVGPNEKQAAEKLLPSLSAEFQNVYNETREGMGQRWLLFDLARRTAVFDDILRIIQLRRAKQTTAKSEGSL